MKGILCLVVACVTGSLASSQPIPRADLAGPERTVRDGEYGLSFGCPPGWQVQQGMRWGDLEATLLLQAPAALEATPAVYYQVNYAPPAPAADLPAWLMSEAARKAQLRASQDGFPDYANRPESLVARTIEGSPALSWIADFTENGRKRCELLTHVVDAKGHVLFFMRMPAEQLAAAQPGFEALVASARLTDPAVFPSLNPHAVAGRTLHRAKEYSKALAEFTTAFQTDSIRPGDLVAAAATASLAGEREQAFKWLRLAVSKGWSLPGRLTSNADFLPLKDTPEWEQILATLQSRIARAPDTVTDQPLQKTLLAILAEDQKYRQQIPEVEKKFGRDSNELRALWATMAEKDAANLVQVKAILDTRGWVGPEVIGSQANNALFLVIQHADHATQVKYLPMMREAVRNGKAKASSLALLEDRVALREGRPQIYGSQIGRDSATGKYYVLPLEDPDQVDSRRAAVDLPPLAEYVKHWEMVWDVEAFKREQAARAEAKP